MDDPYKEPYPGAPIVGRDVFGRPIYKAYDFNAATGNNSPTPPTPTNQPSQSQPQSNYQPNQSNPTNSSLDPYKPPYQGAPVIGYDVFGKPLYFNAATGYQGPQNNAPSNSSSQQQTNDFENYNDLPDSIKNNPNWQLLTKDQKALAYFTYKSQNATTDAQKADATRALEQAKNLVDPFFKEQIRIAQDEITRNVNSTTKNAESKVQSLNDRIRQIKEDLTYNKDQLSLDQQSELASQLRTNQEDLSNLQQQMAESGLAFSSPRQRAEQLLNAQQQDISESTQRKYNRLAHDAQTQADRGLAEANQNINDINRQKNDTITDILRSGEAKLGSNNLPNPTGTLTLGGITGSIENDRQGAVTTTQNNLINRQNPFNF